MTKFSAAQQSQLAQIGAFLRENREKQGKSLEDIAINTYIRPQLLNGIEMGDPDLLPEPIFVQGFIRRYAENLGLKGLELSQQFTVTSIPSTPRPAPRTADVESSTTRLTRPATSTNTQSSAPAAAANTMFSAGNVSEPFPNNQSAPGRAPQPQTNLPPDDIPVIVDDAVRDSAAPDLTAQDLTAQDVSVPDLQTPDLQTPPDIPVISNELDTPLGDGPLGSTDSSAPSAGNANDDFADKVAAFDQTNLTLPESEAPVADMPTLTPPSADLSQADTAEINLPNGALNLELPDASSPQVNDSFNDELPAAFTTQVTSTDPGAAPRTAYAPEPVGVELSRDTEGPNLKPFAIGAIVLAAFTAGVVLIANLLGGDRTSPVTELPESGTDPTIEAVEQPVEATDPPAAETTPEAAPTPSPAASSSPVYVEAEATAETYVSVRVDGVIIFEDIMQPGDTLLWEGEEVIDVYSGNAGGLTVAANGEPGEVLGEDGQLGQKIFEAP